MSASLKQMIANRLNALHSSGPTSTDGKARSSQNARSHGLSRAVGATPPAEWADLIESRKSSWRSSYHPADEAQQWLFGRLVTESVRLDQCEARISAARQEWADRASESWDDDRRAEVAELGARLSKAPDRIQPLLVQSKHGVQWMLDRWEELADALRHLDSWTTVTWHTALDLIGLPNDSRASSGPWDIHPEDPTAAPGLDFIQQNIDALRGRLTAFLDDRDARARADAVLGLELDDPKPIRLLERYAADARRRVRWSLAELRTLQSTATTSQSAATPSGPPGPRPDRRKLKQESSLPQSNPPARNEPNPTETPARNEPIATESPARNEPNPAETPARNEPNSPPSADARPTLISCSGPAVLLNRRARRAQAAASRRRS